MLFSQTSGQTLESRPVFYSKSSEDEGGRNVPAPARCAPSQFALGGNYSQPRPRSRQSYSQAAQEPGQAFEGPACAAYEYLCKRYQWWMAGGRATRSTPN